GLVGGVVVELVLRVVERDVVVRALGGRRRTLARRRLLRHRRHRATAELVGGPLRLVVGVVGVHGVGLPLDSGAFVGDLLGRRRDGGVVGAHHAGPRGGTFAVVAHGAVVVRPGSDPPGGERGGHQDGPGGCPAPPRPVVEHREAVGGFVV